MKEIFDVLIKVCRAGRPAALAVVAAVSGSSPQAPGAAAVFTSEGLQAGTLGGGVLEAEAEKRAREALVKHEARLLVMDLQADLDSRVEAACGGKVTIVIDGQAETDLAVFEAMAEAAEKRESGVLVCRILPGSRLSLSWRWTDQPGKSGEASEEEIKQALRTGKPAWERYPGGWILALPFFPRCRLVIAGAGHVGRALSHLGHWLNFEVTVIDDRAEFARRERLSDVDRIIQDDIPAALQKFPIGADTFVVIVTRGHAQDAEALRACIGRDAAYLGMMGSARKVELMRRSFLEQGWATAEDWERIHTPIGLRIGSRTVNEIAVSIAAQLVRERAGREKEARLRP